MLRPLLGTTAALSLVGATLALAPAASAIDPVDTSALRKAVTVDGILGHERVLQRIAADNGGTRASGTPGYAASTDYFQKQLKAAGYRTYQQEFTFPFFREVAPATLNLLTPKQATLNTATFQFSGSGDVTGRVIPTKDVQIPPAPVSSSTSGCEPEDFTDPGPDPAIALIQRGTCTFEIKAANAQAAGYEAVIIFNEGQEGRTELLNGTLGRVFNLPVVGLTFADGQALYKQTQTGPVTARVTTSTEADLNAKTTNLIAETRTGDVENSVVVGSHLDSVVEGAGGNDNGSGASATLEIALQMAKLKIQPRQQVRFAFWGAEESGLLGAEYYVNNLTNRGLSRISANLNFDMIGSSNFARFVYDGDGSDSAPGPAGSDVIEKLFNRYFRSQGLATEPTPFDGRSDYGPFIAVGIPAGGLFSGAEGIKTEAQVAKFGGTAGVAYDPCYHQACDDVNNLSTKALAQMGDAAADAVATLALSKTDLFGERRPVARTAAATSDVQYDGSRLVK